MPLIKQNSGCRTKILPSTECLFKRMQSECWANTPVQDIWQMLFEFYWLRSCRLSPFTSQWVQRWPLCCLAAPCVIGPNTIKCTFSIWGSKQQRPLRCPRARRGPAPVTSGTWTVTLIYKQVTSATTAFTQGQLRCLYMHNSSEKQTDLNHIVFPKSGDMTAHQQHMSKGSQLGLELKEVQHCGGEILCSWKN